MWAGGRASAAVSADDRLGDNSVRELMVCPAHLKTGYSGSKGVTELTRWELWSERGDTAI